uniref:Uncharacterized protein n=1 Tax=Timema shepardi TaxID=629360 RepID=A0A7R9AT29_TIMSH|nr:unnamed protein product [Timema shepardi]
MVWTCEEDERGEDSKEEARNGGGEQEDKRDSLHDRIEKGSLGWFGRVKRMKEGRIPRRKLEMEVVILSSSVHIEKADIYKFSLPWLGTGLLTSTGQLGAANQARPTGRSRTGCDEIWISALAFVPENDLDQALDLWAEELPDNLQPLIDWFEDNYIGRRNRRGVGRRV